MNTGLMEAPTAPVAVEPPATNIKLPAVKYGATEGPLKDLIPIFVDVETFMDIDAGISLKSQTLRQYIASSYLTAIAIALGDEEPEAFIPADGKQFTAEELKPIIDALSVLANDPNYVFVAHNAAFDIRVLRFMLGIPQPRNVWCTVEGAMGAWPELPGGYSLLNLGEKLLFPKNKRKLHIDLNAGKYTIEELKIYNARDVVAMQELYYRQIARLPANEQRIALLTHNVRRFYFEVDSERLDQLIITLDKNAKEARFAAGGVKMTPDDPDFKFLSFEDEIDADGVAVLDAQALDDVFNRKNVDQTLTSIRGIKLIQLIKERFGVKLPSTSLKKLSPVWQAKHPKIVELLRQTTRANKMLSHTRRSKFLKNVPEIDVELGYARAHTGRFSSPGTGKSLNIHNIPKHDVAIAKPVREIFKLPPGKCFVRGDLSNVEYRVEGWLCDCKTVVEMFDEHLGGDRYSDPYCKGWKSMTTIDINKKDPVRQVSKSAILGLGFSMSAFGYAQVLLRVCADPKSKITEATLKNMILSLRWPIPPDLALKIIYERTGCSPTIAVAAWNVHRLFNAAHPEFARVAEWLVRCVDVVASIGDARFAKDPIARFHRSQFLLDEMAQSTRAPDRNKIRLFIDDDYRADSPSVRVACGPWPATVCWREPMVRANKHVDNGKPRLCILKANGTEKTFTKQLAIENVTQAAARNALCYGLLRLEDEFGMRNVLHVHDEALLIVDRNREAVLHAKEQLTKVYGPKANNPLDWAILIKPEEISVTQSLWESEDDIMHVFDKEKNVWKGGDRWGKIERGEADMFANLP
jgi:3'-5' exonuclease